MQNLRRGHTPGQLTVNVHVLTVHGRLNGHLRAAGLRAFVDAACGRDVRVLIDDAGRQVFTAGINAFVGGYIGTEDRSFVQALPDSEDFAVVNDNVRLFELARFFTGPYRRPFEPNRALSRPFDVAVGDERIHDFALYRIRLGLVCRGLFLGLTLANGAPFDPGPVRPLSTAFPNAAVHPNVARQAPPSVQAERVEFHPEAHRPSIWGEIHFVIGGVDDHLGFRFGQIAGHLQRQHAIGHGQIVCASDVHLIAVDVRVLLSLNPVLKQLRVRVKNWSVGDQDIRLEAFCNPAHAIGRTDQFGGNFGQSSKRSCFRQPVAHACPHGTSDARWAFEAVRRQGKFDACGVHAGRVRRRQFPVLQFIQPHEAAGVGIAYVVGLGVIQREYKRGSRRLEFIQSLVCVVSRNQDESVIHVRAHLRCAQPVVPSTGVKKRRLGTAGIEGLQRQVGLEAFVQATCVGIPIRIEKGLLQQGR